MTKFDKFSYVVWDERFYWKSCHREYKRSSRNALLQCGLRHKWSSYENNYKWNIATRGHVPSCTSIKVKMCINSKKLDKFSCALLNEMSFQTLFHRQDKKPSQNELIQYGSRHWLSSYERNYRLYTAKLCDLLRSIQRPYVTSHPLLSTRYLFQRTTMRQSWTSISSSMISRNMRCKSILTRTEFVAVLTMKSIGLNMFSLNMFRKVTTTFAQMTTLNTSPHKSPIYIHFLHHLRVDLSWNMFLCQSSSNKM